MKVLITQQLFTETGKKRNLNRLKKCKFHISASSSIFHRMLNLLDLEVKLVEIEVNLKSMDVY